MSTINPLFSGQYYQLANQTGSGAGGGKANSQLAALENALKSYSGQVSEQASTGNSSYMLDLSPQAKSYLQSINNGSFASANESFVLTADQQKKIDDILQKYKDSDFNQDTYNQIQNELKAAGLSTDRLAMLDKANSFNATGVLVDALNGKDSGVNPAAGLDNSAQQTKADNFMQQILKQWKSISTKAPR